MVIQGGLSADATPDTVKMFPPMPLEPRQGQSHHHALSAQWQFGFAFTPAKLGKACTHECEPTRSQDWSSCQQKRISLPPLRFARKRWKRVIRARIHQSESISADDSVSDDGTRRKTLLDVKLLHSFNVQCLSLYLQSIFSWSNYHDPLNCFPHSSYIYIYYTSISMYIIWGNTLVIKSLTGQPRLRTYLPSTALISLCLRPSCPKEYSIRERRSGRRFRFIRNISSKPRVVFGGSVTYSASNGWGTIGGKSTEEKKEEKMIK